MYRLQKGLEQKEVRRNKCKISKNILWVLQMEHQEWKLGKAYFIKVSSNKFTKKRRLVVSFYNSKIIKRNCVNFLNILIKILNNIFIIIIFIIVTFIFHLLNPLPLIIIKNTGEKMGRPPFSDLGEGMFRSRSRSRGRHRVGCRD